MHNFTSYLNQISPLSSETQSLMTSVFVLDGIKKGDFFINEGEYASEIAFLEEGVVRAFYTNVEGNEYNKTFFTAPAIIGSYAALITKEKNKLPQQALTDCVIWRAQFDTIERLSEVNIEVERLRRKISEGFFVWNEKKQLEVGLLDARERYLIFRKEYPELEEKIPQYHIASYLGISPTQLSRIRKKLI